MENIATLSPEGALDLKRGLIDSLKRITFGGLGYKIRTWETKNALRLKVTIKSHPATIVRIRNGVIDIKDELVAYDAYDQGVFDEATYILGLFDLAGIESYHRQMSDSEKTVYEVKIIK